jgi:hypothetical protein
MNSKRPHRARHLRQRPVAFVDERELRVVVVHIGRAAARGPSATSPTTPMISGWPAATRSRLPIGSLGREQLARELLTDYHSPRCLGIVLRTERPSPQQRNANRLEVGAFDDTLLRLHLARVGRVGWPRAPAVIRPGDRQAGHCGRSAGARQRREPGLEVAMESGRAAQRRRSGPSGDARRRSARSRSARPDRQSAAGRKCVARGRRQ